jgi:uncharacterized repeat protein (TIGR03847 family)
VAGEVEFDPVDSVAVGTVGRPGQRTFYLQASSADRHLILHVEKVQVQALAERAIELLQGRELGPPEKPAAFEPPDQADWRAGELGLGYDEDRGRVAIAAQELAAGEETDPVTLRRALMWLRPAQMLALAVRALELVRAGRPACPMCGLPMDPNGHTCPRSNGKSPIFV